MRTLILNLFESNYSIKGIWVAFNLLSILMIYVLLFLVL